MSIFDKIKKGATEVAKTAAQSFGNKSETFTFVALPESLAEMKALPEAELTSPYQTAALTLCALCAYAADKNIGTEMLNFLRGPRPLSGMDISFLNDRFRDGTHVPFSYFEGATPENDYTPNTPFKVTVESNPYSEANEGYMKLFLKSSGADNAREVVMRKTSDGKWLLWDQVLLVSIREPKSQNPWA